MSLNKSIERQKIIYIYRENRSLLDAKCLTSYWGTSERIGAKLRGRETLKRSIFTETSCSPLCLLICEKATDWISITLRFIR